MYYFRRLFIKLLLFLLFAIIAVVFCLRLTGLSNSLPFEAVKLVNTNGWGPTTDTSFVANFEGQSPTRTPVYAWLSDHEVLACRKVASARFEFFRRDTTSGKETRLTQLNEKIAASSVGLEDGFRLSPDGKFILWHTPRFGPGKEACWHIAALDATYFSDRSNLDPATVKWDYAPASAGQLRWDWEQDSRRWTLLSGELAGGLFFLRYDKDNNTDIKPVEIPLGRKYNHVWSGYPTYLIGFTKEGRSLSTRWDSALSTINVLEASIKPPFQPLRVTPMRLPQHPLANSISLSPQKDKLLWGFIVRTVPHPPFTEFQHGDFEELWVSEADGSHMKRIVVLPLDQYSSLESIFWMPDGKHVSFIYEDNLYKIDVP